MNKNRTKVLFVIPSSDSGGIENYLLRFLTFCGKEFESIILVRNPKKGVLHGNLSQVSSEIFYMPLGYINPIKLIHFSRVLRIKKVDTIVDFNANFAGSTLLVAYLLNVKNRIAFYRQGKDHYEPSFARNIVNYLMNFVVKKLSTKILSNSKSAFDYFFPERGNDSKYQVIYNGINFELFKKLPNKPELRRKYGFNEDDYIIGHSGRKDPIKNAEAIYSLAKEYDFGKPIKFVLVGQHTEDYVFLNDPEVKNLISAMGFQSEMHEILNCFDAFIFPSFSEGQPNALIEAMAVGLPIIASNIPSIKECLPDERQQNLSDPYNHSAFAKQLENLLDNSSDYIIDLAWLKKRFDAIENFKLFKRQL